MHNPPANNRRIWIAGGPATDIDRGPSPSADGAADYEDAGLPYSIKESYV